MHEQYYAPAYSDDSNWAALPWKEDFADRVPADTLYDRQDRADVDVFYVHPTSFYNPNHWNAELSRKMINNRTDRIIVKHQASVFNGSCKVYAPRYRQATIHAFWSETDKSDKAFEVAYNDVREAFIYYLNNYNKGRPFILAGHSQGASHIISLLIEFEDQAFIQDQLVTAYIVGMPVLPSYFERLKPCENATETGCYNGWSTMQHGERSNPIYEQSICTNPLNWKIDGTYASRLENKGAVVFNYNGLRLNFCDAQSNTGILWVNKPKYWITSFVKNYHVGDINMFWMNIRYNVAQRIKAFQEDKR